MKMKKDLKLFAKYISLNVMSMIGLSCYILADTFFIANGLGAKGLTALNLAIPVYSFISGVGLMLGVGGATKYAIFKAQGNEKEGNRVFMNGIYAAGIIAFLFAAAGLFASGGITRLLGADESVFAMTNIYIKMILFFSPAFILNNIVNCFVRNDGDPKLSMIAMLAGSFSNIILDYIFIYPMKLGMFGAVLATGFAPVIGLFVLSIHFIRKNNHFRFRMEHWDGGFLWSAVSLGIPSLVLELSSGIVMIIYNILILKLAGNIGVAAYGVIANISLVVLSIFNGIAQGMQPVVSDAFGRGKKESVKRFLKYGLWTMGVLSVLIYAGLFFKADGVTLLFNSEKDMVMQELAVRGLRLYFMAVPFAGFNIILASYFASVEKAVPAQVISLLRGIVLIVPVVFFMANVWGVDGIWLSFSVTELLTAFAGFLFLFCRARTTRTER